MAEKLDGPEFGVEVLVERAPALKGERGVATIGNALDWYDFLTYAFFSIQIGHAFFPSHDPYQPDVVADNLRRRLHNPADQRNHNWHLRPTAWAVGRPRCLV